MGWVEVPSHRVLAVTSEEFLEQFEILNSEGQPVRLASEKIYRIVRKRDGMQFILPRYHRESEDMGRVLYLEPYFG